MTRHLSCTKTTSIRKPPDIILRLNLCIGVDKNIEAELKGLQKHAEHAIATIIHSNRTMQMSVSKAPEL